MDDDWNAPSSGKHLPIWMVGGLSWLANFSRVLRRNRSKDLLFSVSAEFFPDEELIDVSERAGEILFWFGPSFRNRLFVRFIVDAEELDVDDDPPKDSIVLPL